MYTSCTAARSFQELAATLAKKFRPSRKKFRYLLDFENLLYFRVFPSWNIQLETEF